jgi:hypothetical protein
MRLSFVYSVRDPDYGEGLLRRMQTSLSTLAETAESEGLDYEIIVVEWNPPTDKKLIADLIQWSQTQSGRLRFLEVPYSLHRTFPNHRELPFQEYIAKNVGIRRAKGEWVLACSPDVIFNNSLLATIAHGQLDKSTFYRIDRRDVGVQVPIDVPVQERFRTCSRQLIYINTQFGTIPVTDGWDGELHSMTGLVSSRKYRREFARLRAETELYHLFAPKRLRENGATKRLLDNLKRLKVPMHEVHTNASGDFLMMSRESWFKLRGYPEISTHAHIDSFMCWTAAASGMKQQIIRGSARLYHQEHDRSLQETFPQTDRRTWEPFILDIIENGVSPISNSDEWGLANERLKETVL